VCSPGGTCQAGSVPEPVFGASASATFSGAGNLAPVPPVATVVKPKPRVLSRAEKLAAALRACRKKKVKRKRVGCEKQARRAYGARAHAKSSSAESLLAVGSSRGGVR
jgi:hypothetical protein